MALCLVAGSVNSQCLTTTGPTNNCTYGDAIDNITINAISVSNAGCSGTSTGYTFFTTPVWNFTLGSSYPISLSVGGATYNQGVRIWIDINNNGEFETTESVYNSTAAAQTHTGTLVIPAVGATAQVRMRVMCNYNRVPTASEACLSNGGGYGEVEDYLVNLSPAVVPGPDASAGAVLSPANSSCGKLVDSVVVKIYNTGTDTVTNLPIVTNLSGLSTGSFNNNIIEILPGDSAIVFVTTVNSQVGGNLAVQLITQDTADVNNANDTLDQAITILNSEDITITGPASVCDGDNAVLQLNTVGGETYTWFENSVGGTMIISADSLVATGLTMDTTFAVSSSNTCRASDSTTILVMPTTPITVTGPDSVCEGSVLTLALNALSGESYNWYQDSVGGTFVDSGAVLVTTATLGTTQYVAASSNTCRPAGVFQIVVLPLPSATVSSSANFDTLSFTSTASNTISYAWDFGDGNTSTQANPTHIYGVNGTFVACLTVTNACGSTTTCDTVISSVMVSIPGYADGKIALFPNPTEDQLTVQLSNMEGLEGEWVITDLRGKLIQRKAFKLANGNDETVVSLRALASGSYLFRLQSGGYTYSHMILKQ